MNHSSLDKTLRIPLDAEASSPWRLKSVGEISFLLERVAERFLLYCDPLADETAERMGIAAAEVYFETVFPSVWGILSISDSLRRANPTQTLEQHLRQTVPPPLTDFAGFPACQLLPANRLEKMLLPGVTGYVLLNHSEDDFTTQPEKSQCNHEKPGKGIALCLLPFNLASIGALDIVHLLCNRGLRVVAKISEKVGFSGPYLEKIFAPFVEQHALTFVYGGPERGAWLVEQPEFEHIHVTGSIETGRVIKRSAGSKRVTSELGGVTPALVLPDVLSRREGMRHVARQVAYGMLANNGQHCVSFQLIVLPDSYSQSFKEVLREEIALAASREGEDQGNRLLIDHSSACRLEAKLEVLHEAGSEITPIHPKARGRSFPATLIEGLNCDATFLREEAFGPVAALVPLPGDSFLQKALEFANSSTLAGDLGISIFTSNPTLPEVKRLAAELRHGVVAINMYPGVAFATSLPWGAGPLGLSGQGWSHNYRFLPENLIRKVVLLSPLGKKGMGPLRWEDPWLLNVSGDTACRLAKALVGSCLAYFQRKKWRLFNAQFELFRALFRREIQSRRGDRMRFPPSPQKKTNLAASSKLWNR
jgi:acyl-CoA reductase-like NAD-dependent aldehyde dehydrogenase